MLSPMPCVYWRLSVSSVGSEIDTKYDDEEKSSHRPENIALKRVIYLCLYFYLMLNISYNSLWIL